MYSKRRASSRLNNNGNINEVEALRQVFFAFFLHAKRRNTNMQKKGYVHLKIECGTANPFYNPEIEAYVYEDLTCRNPNHNETLNLNKVKSYNDDLMDSEDSLSDQNIKN